MKNGLADSDSRSMDDVEKSLDNLLDRDYRVNQPIGRFEEMKTTLMDPSKTALVIVDLQKGIVRIATEPYPAGTVVANATKLARLFRKNKMPVFLVRVTPSADGKDMLKPVADHPMSWNLARSVDWADIVPELGPEPGDFIITKRQWGAFHGTELDLQLRRRGIHTIVLCGIATNLGVESTARFAYEYGYQQIFVEDATAAHSQEEHAQTMKMIFSRIGRIRKTKEILSSFLK